MSREVRWDVDVSSPRRVSKFTYNLTDLYSYPALASPHSDGMGMAWPQGVQTDISADLLQHALQHEFA